jgi:MFS family permease
LTPLTYASFCLALAQSATFTFLVTFAVMRLGFDLVVAGILFAVLQVGGIAGRVLLGGAADWIGSATVLLKAAVIASAITTTLLAFAAPEWPLWTLWALIGITGITVASWNGLVMADIADIVPPERMAETATGVSIVLFVGSVIGPIGFALVLDAAGSYQPAFLMLSVWSVSAALFFMRKPR